MTRRSSASGWERWIEAALSRAIPADRRGEVAGDLVEEFRARRAAEGRVPAVVRLVVDAWSVRRAYRRERPGATATLAATMRALRAGARLKDLRRSPAFALGAAISLGLGVTVLAGTMAFVDAIVLRPISRVDPDRVFRVTTTSVAGAERLQFAYPELTAIVPFFGAAADVAGVHLVPVVARLDDAGLQTLAEVVSGSYFRVLAVSPLEGRVLTAADDSPSAPPAAVISESYRRAQFGAASGATGRTLRLNGVPFTVVGVVPDGGSVSFAASSTDVWIPIAHADGMLDPGWRVDARRRILAIVGRQHAEARSPLAGAAERATRELAQRFPETRADDRVVIRDGDLVVGAQRRMASGVAAVLAVLAALVFLLVLSNVAGLFGARWLALERSVAIRRLLGAPASTIAAGVLAEGVAVGALGGVVATAGYALLRGQLSSIGLLPTLSLRLDLAGGATTTASIVLVSLAAGTVLAAGPAWRVSRRDAGREFAGTRGGFGTRGAGRMRRWLLASQVGGTLVLLSAAALLGRTAASFQSADLGVDVDRLAIVDLDVVPRVSADRVSTLAVDALAAVRAIPGIESAAFASGAPVDSVAPLVEIAAGDGRVVAPRTTLVQVGEGYFETVGVRIVDGRPFRADDAGAAVAIVNETLAAQIGGGAVGGSIRIGAAGREHRVIGVSRNAKYRSVSERSQSAVYVPVAPDFHLSIVARAGIDTRTALRDLQRALDGVGPGVQGFFPRTGRDHLAFDLLPVDAGSRVAGSVSILAVVLSGIALYGLVAWLVEMRRGEFGLRLAIGATRADVRRLVLTQALWSAAPGLLAGLPIALAAGWLLRSSVSGVSAPDATSTLAGAAGVLGVVVTAAWWPARRAAGVDPLALLRERDR